MFIMHNQNNKIINAYKDRLPERPIKLATWVTNNYY